VDQRSFDRLARLLGEATDRRAGLKAAFGALLGAGGAAALADAEAKKNRGRDAGPEAGKKKRGKTCKPACGSGFDCVKVGKTRECVCATGVTCGEACCRVGEACEDGQCAAAPEPVECIAAGEPCKGVGRACCDGRVCASGQGGMTDVACYVPKTGACTTRTDCVYGMACVGGRCAPPAPVEQLGGACDAAAQQLCAYSGATCAAYTEPGAPGGTYCTLPVGMTCTGDPDCTCYKCFYPNGWASGGSRSGRASANTKACCYPSGQACQNDNQCCTGLSCVNGTCGGTICTPPGGDCTATPCCDGTCSNGVCPGGFTCAAIGGSCASASCCDGLACAGEVCAACTVTVSDFAEFQTALANASASTDATVICVRPGTYAFTQTLTGTSISPTNKITIVKLGTGGAIFDGGAAWSGTMPSPTVTGGRRLLILESSGCTGSCAGFEIDGIEFRNGNANPDRSGDAGCLRANVDTRIRNGRFWRCKAYDGGAIWNDRTGNDDATTMTVQNVTFESNLATNNGGVFYVDSNLTLIGSTMTGNVSQNGRGGVIFSSSEGNTFTLDGVTMTGNSAVTNQTAGRGGAGINMGYLANTFVCRNQQTGPTTWSIDNNVTAQSTPPADCVVDEPGAATLFAGCGCKSTADV